MPSRPGETATPSLPAALLATACNGPVPANGPPTGGEGDGDAGRLVTVTRCDPTQTLRQRVRGALRRLTDVDVIFKQRRRDYGY